MTVTIRDTESVLRQRGLGAEGRLQQLLDREVAVRCDPYVPRRTGRLAQSANTESPGQVRYGLPYAARVYYQTALEDGLRGSRWFDRMVNDQGTQIVAVLQDALGGGRHG